MQYFIKTFGCQMNISDSERIAGFLESLPYPRLPKPGTGGQANPLLCKERGLKPTEKINDADVVIFNTCGVRQMAEDRVYGQIHNLRKSNPEVKIILTGCLANRKDVQRKLKERVDLFCEIKDFPEEIAKFLNSSKSQDLFYLSLPPKYTEKKQAYVPIMTGCNNFCTYCVVPYARGRETSRPVREIFSEIENLAKKKYKEIIFLGQNVNSYQFKKVTFPKLLDSLAQKFTKINFKFLTSHPKDFSETLMKVIAKNKNISREIHLPVQAGSDKILKAMNRPYTKNHYLNLIKKAQELIPEVSFTTDVIVGFPGETKKDFEDTIKVFKKVKFNEAYINKYSPRPGTVAFSLGDPISWEEKKRREKILREILKKYKKVKVS